MTCCRVVLPLLPICIMCKLCSEIAETYFCVVRWLLSYLKNLLGFMVGSGCIHLLWSSNFIQVFHKNKEAKIFRQCTIMQFIGVFSWSKILSFSRVSLCPYTCYSIGFYLWLFWCPTHGHCIRIPISNMHRICCILTILFCRISYHSP